jgi:hypothetical protein
MNLNASMILVALLSSAAQSGEFELIVGKYDGIKYAHQYGKFYRSLFAACDASALAALKFHENDSIATQAAWETVALTVPKEQGPKVYRPDSTQLSWFIGFFEGRNRIAVPNWWSAVVTDSRANRRDNIYPGKPQERPYHRSTIEGLACPINASVTEKDRVVTYRAGDDSIALPPELLDRSDHGELSCNISCAFTKEHCFVAVHDDVGYTHSVVCIDRKTDKIVWKSQACGCWWGGATGQHESCVSVVPTNDSRVFVFGCASIGFYAHGFDVGSGKTVIQFSNNY